MSVENFLSAMGVQLKKKTIFPLVGERIEITKIKKQHNGSVFVKVTVC